jgi:hypothetical protein
MVPILFFYFSVSKAFEPHFSEPDVQCTIVKVHRREKLAGVKKFPSLYQTINNDPVTSRFFIAGRELQDANPETLFKSAEAETISIKTSTISIVLELKGRPISRHGDLKINGKKTAEVTCH